MRIPSKALTAVVLMLAVSPAAAARKASPSAGAPTSGVTGDVRCLLTMAALASNKANQQPATLGVYFFEGRISARAPGLDLPAALKAEAARLGAADLQMEAKRCAALVQQASQSLQAAQATFSGPVTPPAPAPGPTPAPTPPAPK
jgi:hypothetical protein